MVLVEIFVEHAQPADGVAAFVREERVADGIPLSERAQRLDRVVADGERRHVAAGQLAGNLLQLDQLHLAEGSPSGAAMEYDSAFRPRRSWCRSMLRPVWSGRTTSGNSSPSCGPTWV